MTNKKQHGFTLIELLVVIALLAIIAPTAYSLLESSVKVNKHVKASNEESTSLAIFMDWFENDIKQLALISSRNQNGSLESPLQLSTGKLSFTRTGWGNPMGKERPQLQKVEYKVADNETQRIFWDTFHRTPDSSFLVKKFEGISISDIEVMSSTGDWHKSWPISRSDEMAYPVALRCNIKTSKGLLPRFFEINSLTKGSLGEETQ